MIEGNEALLKLLKEKRSASKKIRRKPIPVKLVPFRKLVRQTRKQSSIIGSTDLRQIAKEISTPLKHPVSSSNNSIFVPRP